MSLRATSASPILESKAGSSQDTLLQCESEERCRTGHVLTLELPFIRGSFILISGRLGDIFGYKRMLVIGYSWFAFWSLVAGLSVYSNYVLFIFARVLQGMLNRVPVMSERHADCHTRYWSLDLYAKWTRPSWLALRAWTTQEHGVCSLWCLCSCKLLAYSESDAFARTDNPTLRQGGSILGAVTASLFALAWWPWMLWSFAVTLAIIAVVAAFAIPDPQVTPPPPKSFKQYVEQLDMLAATVGIAALVLFNFAWNQAPIVGWQSPYVIVCLILGVLLFPLFFYLEIAVASDPLIPFSLLNSTNAFVLACIACGWSNFGIWAYYLFQILEVLRGTSPLLTTAYVSPLAISGLIAAVVTGKLLGMLRPAWIMVIAMTMFLAGNLLVATVPPHQTYWAQIFVTSLVAPWGMDMSFPAATVYLSNSVEKERQGVAASLVNTIVNYSISLGLGFAGTVEGHVNHGGLTPSDILRGYRGALYVGTGLCSVGLALSIVFVAKTYRDDRGKVQAPAMDSEADHSGMSDDA